MTLGEVSEHGKGPATVKVSRRHIWYWLAAMGLVGVPIALWATWSISWSEVCSAVDPRGHRASVTRYSPVFTSRHHFYLEVDGGLQFAVVEGPSTIKVSSSGAMPGQEVVRGWGDRGYIGYLENFDEWSRAPSRMEWTSTDIVVYSRDGVVGRYATRTKQ